MLNLPSEKRRDEGGGREVYLKGGGWRKADQQWHLSAKVASNRVDSFLSQFGSLFLS